MDLASTLTALEDRTLISQRWEVRATVEKLREQAKS